MNSILTYVFPLSRWERAVYIVRPMASSVDLLDRNANCIGSRVEGSEEQIKKALHDDTGKCYWAIVIHAGDLGVLGHRDDGGPPEEVGEYRQAEGEVKDVTEASWSAQTLRASPGMPSGPGTLRGWLGF